ncbi:MAG TPA: DUF4912 domain-containing protein [Pseudomonadota bacterium]|nr:DUF4912 domain-containing protein [Pseudomonadota bacterium]
MKQRDGNMESGAAPSAGSAEVEARAVPAERGPTVASPWVEPPLPETYGVDEVGVLCKDPAWYFVYWEVTSAGLDAARAQLGLSQGPGPGPVEDPARLVLRVLPAAGERRGRDGRDIRDIPVDISQRHGRRYLEAPRQNPVFRVAIGLLSAEGLFAPIAHSQAVRMPPHQASGDTSIEWLHVLPLRGDGKARERIVAASQPHSERGVSFRSPEPAAGSAVSTGVPQATSDLAAGSSGLAPSRPAGHDGRGERG